MARKDPFKRVSVSDRIYDALDKRRLEETKDDFRPLPMNAFCEKILWDYAQGKLTLAGSTQRDPTERRVVDVSGKWIETNQSEHEEEEAPEGRKNVRKHGHQ